MFVNGSGHFVDDVDSTALPVRQIEEKQFWEKKKMLVNC